MSSKKTFYSYANSLYLNCFTNIAGIYFEDFAYIFEVLKTLHKYCLYFSLVPEPYYLIINNLYLERSYYVKHY